MLPVYEGKIDPELMNHDVGAESPNTLKFLIPAKAGIQSFQRVEQSHVTRLRGKSDFFYRNINHTHLDALTQHIERACQAAIDLALHLVA